MEWNWDVTWSELWWNLNGTSSQLIVDCKSVHFQWLTNNEVMFFFRSDFNKSGSFCLTSSLGVIVFLTFCVHFITASLYTVIISTARIHCNYNYNKDLGTIMMIIIFTNQRVRLDKDWIVPTRWSWITEPPLVGQAPSWVYTWTLSSEIKFAEATEAPLFNGNRWANRFIIKKWLCMAV